MIESLVPELCTPVWEPAIYLSCNSEPNLALSKLMDEHLNDAFFARLAAKLPSFKSDLAKKFQAQKASGNGKLKQHPCAACGKHFGSKVAEFSLKPFTPKPYCPKCQSHLDQDGTILVNVMGGRYALIKFKDDAIIASLASIFHEFDQCRLLDLSGKVKIVSDKFLDLVKLHGERIRCDAKDSV